MNFVCVYWGDKYKTDYVQNLYNMVQRHLTIPHKFICFTDHVKLHKIVKGDIEFRQFKHHDYQTWWNKLQLFSEDAELEGPNLYMDLDVVILENINEMATFGDDDTFGVINDFNPQTGFFNSSVMKFNTKIANSAIWLPFLQDKSNYLRHQGDQNVMSMLIKGNKHLKVMPDEWTFSYKWNNRQNPRYHKTEWTFERGVGKVAVFHGHPNPHESDQEWVKTNWK